MFSSLLLLSLLLKPNNELLLLEPEKRLFPNNELSLVFSLFDSLFPVFVPNKPNFMVPPPLLLFENKLFVVEVFPNKEVFV